MFLDSVLFLSLYNVLFLNRFGRWPDGSIFFPILWATWVLSGYVLGRYQWSYGLRSSNTGAFFVLQGAVKVALVVAVSLAGTLTYFWLFKGIEGYSLFRSFLIPYLGCLGFTSLAIQIFLGTLVRNRPIWTDHWLFLGRKEVYERLQYHLKLSRLPIHLVYLAPAQLNILGNASILVDDFAAEPNSVLQSLLEFQHEGRTVLGLQAWCELILQRFPSEFLSDADLLRGEFSIFPGTFQSRLKRLGDVCLSAILLLLTSPILLVSGLLIKIEDRGPILYSQIRSGFNGTHYTIYKLRSMRVNAERNGAQWVKRSDSRITSIGSFLRRTRIDELPQLWCVFTGNMSLIGPRPERPEFDQELDKEIPHYRLRQRMRPGLSGWAQVNYPYGASVEDASNKLSYDLYYLRNFSFWLDLLILFKTIRLVFNAQGSVPACVDEAMRF
ncbi:exopolysaccharide biosynthesis polyprenyl glycosylphosphotransferase [Synechococcus sp. PROS-9-1]|uniref:exopolysaccharide biosynthesis polyprenyl glycosylphosphotransferase n=1 Tax=Synechococcus sp. PROS-9-1 TaxID=1968775 RepID=UPI0021059224|nr:exopolysaccharide biosynthesis polyprenyl glycosylphosphotransferase [Synechococcus sp. PROS-9-1]